MPINLAMSGMNVTELALWITLGILFWAKGLHRRFPAMSAYLVLRIVSTPALLAASYLQSRPSGRDFYLLYLYGDWTVYIAGAALVFFICLEILRSALSAFPGLMKFGLMIFKWAAIISAIVSFASVPFVRSGLLINDISFRLVRSVSILELCLLAFLCLSMSALHLSARNLAFGFALGFGVMSANEFVLSCFMSAHASMIAPVQLIYQSFILVAIAIWIAYCALPEPARKPVVMPVTSRIYRWNEIASALGHTGTQVAMQQPANSFFLTDVEKVVEKVLKRNMDGQESEIS